MGNVMFMRKGEVHTAPKVPFPIEPTAYELIETVTASKTFTAPEDGYYQIEVFGASGSGGAAGIDNDEGHSNRMLSSGAASGGGGGSGAYSCSKDIKLNKGDTITIANLGIGSTATITINSSYDESSSHTITCKSGGNGGAGRAVKPPVLSDNYTWTLTVGGAGSAGTASGGNYSNLNGKAGTTGSTLLRKADNYHVGGNITNITKTTLYTNSAGGGIAVNGGNAGGAGGRGKIVGTEFNYSIYPTASVYTSAGSGKAAYIKIYRGNTNSIYSA